mgnify:FL=1
MNNKRTMILALCVCFLIVLFTAEGIRANSRGQKVDTSGDDTPAEEDAVQNTFINWGGYYSCGTITGFSLDFFVYPYGNPVSGCLMIDGHAEQEDIRERIFTEVRCSPERMQVYFQGHASGQDKKYFADYEPGELLFSLEKQDGQTATVWQDENLESLMSRQGTGFSQRENYGSVSLLNKEERELLLEIQGISQEEMPLYQYFNGEGELQAELFYDEQTGEGTGFYYGPLCLSAFDIHGYEEKVWEDRKFEIKDKNMCSEYEGYHQEEKYNDMGQLTYFKSEALLEMLGEPYVGPVIEIEYTYREDGTLSRKKSYYNQFIWGTTRSTETAYYDEQERLIYVSSYITHGFLEDYYIYEEGNQSPSWCLTLDHMGPDAWATLTKYQLS